MSDLLVWGRVCENCGGTVVFFEDSKYEDWMTIIERLRKEGAIEFSVKETNYYHYNSLYFNEASYIKKFGSKYHALLSQNQMESQASKDFYTKHDLKSIGALITRRSNNGEKKILQDELYYDEQQGGDRRVTYECDYHDIYTLSESLINHEKYFAPVFFRPMSDVESYVCPVCGKNQFLLVWDFPIGYQFLNMKFENEQRARSTARVDSLIATTDNTDIAAIIPKNHTNANDIVLFLNHLIKLEKSIRTTTEHLYDLELIFEETNRKTYIQTFKACEDLEKEYDKKVQAITQALEVVAQKYAHIEAVYESRGLIAPIAPKIISEFSYEPPSEPVPIKAGLFNRAKVSAQNEANMKEYQKKLQEYKVSKEQYENAVIDYKRAKAEYDQSCNQMNAILDKEYQEECAQLILEKDKVLEQREQAICNFREKLKDAPALAFVIKEVEETRTLLRNLIEARGKLRCSGVLHPKYFDIAAVATICEYFETGRAETLAGPSGAYNLYESELRANIIISKLDTIISSLEQIKQNQFKLYNVLCSINDGIENMSGLLQKANESLDNIAVQNEKIIENTAVTAYYAEKTAKYAKINAELTNALGFLVALK